MFRKIVKALLVTGVFLVINNSVASAFDYSFLVVDNGYYLDEATKTLYVQTVYYQNCDSNNLDYYVSQSRLFQYYIDKGCQKQSCQWVENCGVIACGFICSTDVTQKYENDTYSVTLQNISMQGVVEQSFNALGSELLDSLPDNNCPAGSFYNGYIGHYNYVVQDFDSETNTANVVISATKRSFCSSAPTTMSSYSSILTPNTNNPVVDAINENTDRIINAFSSISSKTSVSIDSTSITNPLINFWDNLFSGSGASDGSSSESASSSELSGYESEVSEGQSSFFSKLDNVSNSIQNKLGLSISASGGSANYCLDFGHYGLKCFDFSRYSSVYEQMKMFVIFAASVFSFFIIVRSN